MFIVPHCAGESGQRDVKQATWITIDQRRTQSLGFADDLNIFGNTKDDTERAVKGFEVVGKKRTKNEVGEMKIIKFLDNLTDIFDPDGRMKKLMNFNTLAYARVQKIIGHVKLECG